MLFHKMLVGNLLFGDIFDEIAVCVGQATLTSGLKANGSAWQWGQNGHGQLGTGNTISYSSPVSVIGGHSFIQVSPGFTHSVFLKSDGSVFFLW